MSIAYFIMFAGVSIFHLNASRKNDRYCRSVSKGMILLLLLGFYLESVDTPEGLLVAALILSWLGDLLLIAKGVRWFALGGAAFGAAHVCFILAYAKDILWARVPGAAIAGFALAYGAATLVIFRLLARYLPKKLIPPMLGYLLINGTMNCYAIYRLWSLPSVGTAVTAIGAFLFFASDTSLFFIRFNRDSSMETHFRVMLTYILGELLIVTGMIG